jgi:cell division transport system permease protein
MAKRKQQTTKRITWASITVLISSSILLLMLVLWVNFVFSAQQLSENFKSEITFTLFIKPDAKTLDVKSFEKKIKQRKEIKSVDFISKEQAAKAMQTSLGDDIMNILDFNPLFDSYDLHFHPSYVTIEGLQKVEQDLKKSSIIQDIVYDKSVLYSVNKNLGRITVFFISVSVFLLIIAVVLIYNFIRLSVYSKRFSIRTMQLVGASSWFIQKPFLYRSLILASVSSVLAIGLGFGVLKYVSQQIPGLYFLSNINQFVYSACIIFVFGNILFFISSLFAVKKYLHAKLSELYI